VVGLSGPAGDDEIRLPFKRIGHHEFQLADLVAAGGEAEQVVALEKRLVPPNTLESRAKD
jgi:hypothetical protein